MKTVAVTALFILIVVLINYPQVILVCVDVVLLTGLVVAIPVGIFYGVQKKFWT